MTLQVLLHCIIVVLRMLLRRCSQVRGDRGTYITRTTLRDCKLPSAQCQFFSVVFIRWHHQNLGPIWWAKSN